MKCEICNEDYPSKFYFKTDTICNECYKKQHPDEEEKSEKIENKKQESTEMLKGPLGCISTFIGVLIWGGSTALFYKIGLGGWSILIGLIIALIFGPAIDMGLRAMTGKN